MTMFTNTDSETDATTTRVWFEPNDSRGETVTSSDSSTEKEYQYVTDPKHPVVGTQSNIWNMYGSLFVTLDPGFQKVGRRQPERGLCHPLCQIFMKNA